MVDGLNPMMQVVLVDTSEGLELRWGINMVERWQNVQAGILLPAV